MSTMLGKSAGIALLLAAALIALLATGVFSTGGALGQDDPVAPHLLETLRLEDGGAGADGRFTLDPAFDPEVTDYMITYPFTSTSTETEIRIVARADEEHTTTNVVVSVDGARIVDGSEDDTDVTWKTVVRIEADPEESPDLIGTLIKVTVTAANEDETVYNIRVKQDGSAVNKSEATAVVRVVFANVQLEANVGDDIVLGLKSFGLPDSISKGNVVIDTGNQRGNPEDVRVDGDNVILELGKLNTETGVGNDDPSNVLGDPEDETVTITVNSKAGITNPVKAGIYTVTIDADDVDNDGDAVDARRVVEVVRSLSINPKSGGKGTSVTVTGKGFASGSVTVFRDVNNNDMHDPGTDVTLGTAESSKGVFTLTTTGIRETSNIQAIDLDGSLAPEAQEFSIKQSIKVTPGEVFPGSELTIELVDWGSSVGEVDGIRFGGNNGHVEPVGDQNADGSGDKIMVDVPTNVRLGSLKVEAMVGNSSKGSRTVTVKTHVLTIAPTNAVQGQEITIQGSGFGPNQRITSLTFGTLGSVATSSFNAADSNGNINVTVKVPDDLGSGEQEIKLITMNNRSGTAKLTVPKAALTVSPTEGLRGTRVTVTGTGFPADDLIQIKYDRTVDSVTTAQPVTTANTDTTGNFTATFEIPSFAGIGSTQKITADPQLNTDVADVTADHSTPKPTMTLSPATASPRARGLPSAG